MVIEDSIKNKMTVEFTTDNMVKVHYEDFSGKKIKNLTFQEYAECIINSSRAVQEFTCDSSTKASYEQSKVLPHTKDVSTVTVLTSKETNTNIYVMFRKRKTFTANYYDDIFKGIECPNILFAVRVMNGVPNKAWVCAVKDDFITDNTEVYRFPFPNVFSDTSICYGSNRVTEVELVKDSDVARMPSMFLSMPWNDHNYGGANKSGKPFRKLLEHLQDNPFDNDWLNPCGAGVTFKSWINKIG